MGVKIGFTLCGSQWRITMTESNHGRWANISVY